jgi:pimeloyl-ACP methyl ester carboxylesterase
MRSRGSIRRPLAWLLPLAVTLGLLSCAGAVPGRGGAVRLPSAEALAAAYDPLHPYPNSSFLEVEGNRLHFLTWQPAPGSETRGRALLIHGFAGSVYCWRYLGPALAELGFLVVAVDCPPFGWSEPSRAELEGRVPGNPESHAALIWSFLDAFDALDAKARADGTARPAGGALPDRGWLLVGHSLGGRMAAWMAASRPRDVSRLVLIAPAVFGKLGAPALAASPLFQGLLPRELDALLHDESAIRSALAKVYGRKPDAGELAGYWAPLLRAGGLPAFVAWSRTASETRSPPLAAIDVPTLVLWGGADSIVKPEAARLAASLPDAIAVTIAGGGHCVMETRFGETWMALRQFLGPPPP